MKKAKTIFKFVSVAIGIGIAIFIAERVGFDSIADNLRVLGWRAAPILMLPAVWFLLYTLGWDQFLKRLKGSIGLFELFRAKIAGEAVNTVTPASFLGGDPVRVYILKKHFPVAESAASVVVDRTLHTMAILTVISLGVIAAFWRVTFLPLNMRYGLPIVLIISFLFMGFIFAHQRRGLFTFIMYMMKKLRIKKSFSAGTVAKYQELDGHIADFYIKDPNRFWVAFFYHLAGRLLGIVEIYVVGVIFYSEFTWYAALLLCALAPLVNFLFAFIPGAIGILEGAYSGVLYLLHMPPEVGLSIQIFKRIRSVIWIALGFIALGTHDRKKILSSHTIEEIQAV